MKDDIIKPGELVRSAAILQDEKGRDPLIKSYNQKAQEKLKNHTNQLGDRGGAMIPKAIAGSACLTAASINMMHVPTIKPVTSQTYPGPNPWLHLLVQCWTPLFSTNSGTGIFKGTKHSTLNVTDITNTDHVGATTLPWVNKCQNPKYSEGSAWALHPLECTAPSLYTHRMHSFSTHNGYHLKYPFNIPLKMHLGNTWGRSIWPRVSDIIAYHCIS